MGRLDVTPQVGVVAVDGDLPGEVRIKSIGSPAYSLVHSLMWMERMAPLLEGKLVVWFVYNGNDLADNVYPAQN